MKVFISWSGALSRGVAEKLGEWLPNVLQAVDPWISANIDKGARWASEVASELSNTSAGILCVTPENLEAPWLNFEAGALAKALEKTFVCPYLVGLGPTDLKGPLAQFQATEASSEDDSRRLIGTLNKALGDSALPGPQLDKAFGMWWPELESSLKEIQKSAETLPRAERPQREILEEILALAREQERRNVTGIHYLNRPFPLDLGESRERAGEQTGLKSKTADAVAAIVTALCERELANSTETKSKTLGEAILTR